MDVIILSLLILFADSAMGLMSPMGPMCGCASLILYSGYAPRRQRRLTLGPSGPFGP